MQGILENYESAEARETTAPTDTVVVEREAPYHMPTTSEDYTYPPFTIADLKGDPTEPLFTEINIPLPRLPKTAPSPHSTLRTRAHSLHSYRPFHHRRGSSSDSQAAKDNMGARPREEPVVKSREVAAAMNLRKAHRRSRTVDALAVVPAVLVLSAELFTPGEEDGRKRSRKEMKWEDGMI